jgi:hypothetical protein
MMGKGGKEDKGGGKTLGKGNFFGFGGSIIFHRRGLYYWFGWRSLLEDCITGFA